MLFPFYNNEDTAYTIDDADYWCERVIVWTCDWSHRYATLCELVQNCPNVRQLTRPCIIEALNNLDRLPNTQSLSPDKWFLKVTSDWCLEVADPCVCNDWDKYVIATDWDNNPWPLDSKVRGSCSYDWLYCIDIEEAWPQTLVWRPSGPNWPFINPALPDGSCSDEMYVKIRKAWWEWKVDYECPEDDKPQYAKCIYSAWRAKTSCKDRTVRYFVKHANSIWPIDSWSRDNSNSYIEWDWAIKWTDAFAKPSTYGVINIVKPWVYEIAFSTYITSSQTLHSIRCWLYADMDWSWPREINDIKYQWWEYPFPGWKYWDPAVFNRLFPDEWDWEVFTKNYTRIWWTLENTWLPFARTYILNVTKAPVEIFMAVKPDMRDRDPRVIEENDDDDRYYIQVEWANWNAYWAATTIELTRISDSVSASRMADIVV